MPELKPTSVRLDPWQQDALARHAAKLDRSTSYLVKAAINIYLREQGYSRLESQPELPVPAPAAKPSGGWTPQRKWKSENLRRRRTGLPQISFEEFMAVNPH